MLEFEAHPSIAFYFMEFISSTKVSIHIGMTMTIERKYLQNILHQQHTHANLPIGVQAPPVAHTKSFSCYLLNVLGPSN